MQTEHTYVLWYFSQYFYLFGKLKYFQAMKEHTFVLANKPSQKVLICNLMSYKIIFIFHFSIICHKCIVFCPFLFSFLSKFLLSSFFWYLYTLKTYYSKISP